MRVMLAALLGQVSLPPEVPPTIIDPLPGPYIVFVDDAGGVTPGAEPILANAAKNWLYPPLDTFSVCYQPGTGRDDLNVAVEATEAVAKRLKVLGAGTVVVPPGGRCATGQSSAVVPGPHVYIYGAIRY